MYFLIVALTIRTFNVLLFIMVYDYLFVFLLKAVVVCLIFLLYRLLLDSRHCNIVKVFKI